MHNNQASRRLARLALAASAAALLAACSSDIERLSDYPPINNTQSAPATAQVQAQPVAPAANASAPWRAPTPSWARSSTTYRTAQPSASTYAAPVRQAYRAPAPQPAQPAHAAPRAASNGVLYVKPGQTLFSIARANGKSVRELMAANNLSSPVLKAGQRLVIPGVANPVSPAPTVTRQTSYAPSATTPAAAPAAPAPATKAQPAAAPAGQTNVARTRAHRVQPGETIYALGRKYGVHPKKIASANGFSLNTRLKVGQVVRIPSSDGWNMPAPKQQVARTHQQKPQTRPPVTAIHKPSAPARQVAQTPAKDEDRITAPAPQRKLAQAQPKQSSSAQFIWPVQGSVVARFGQKVNGVKSEGVNIAAPEGAPVRAAADGVVAYAGNELKGYGNLVLIRHPGGWVTAYAHNKALKVKRGDRVRRGQVIATVGKTGSVKRAQLHFELRKGATPVNPVKYLGTMTAMR